MSTTTGTSRRVVPQTIPSTVPWSMAPPSTIPLSPLSPPPARSSSSRSSASMISPAPAFDPAVLLDSIDRNRTRNQDGSSTFDPIEFLNKHFVTEQSLAQNLPPLRDAVGSRMQVLNDRISNALQRQSETAEMTRRHIQDAKASVIEMERRILQVKEKASQSEKAVLEITAEMKRLDCAKRHLQRTITTLKQLHMLVHAVEQLRVAVNERPFPDYKTASHLVDAITQLFQHFHAYTAKVQPMRILSNKVTEYQETLRQSVVTGFRVVAFGYVHAMRLEGKVISEDEDDLDLPGRNVMPVPVMQGGILLIDSLGEACRVRFIHDFCQDLLGDYLREFEPPNRTAKPTPRVSSFKVAEQKSEGENAHAGLDHVDKRFSWFLNGPLQSINDKFPGVFPPRWNLQATLSSIFLQLVRCHGDVERRFSWTCISLIFMLSYIRHGITF
jgi:vacuolar protein sorting-associated protein 53